MIAVMVILSVMILSMPARVMGHRNQLNFKSGNHKLYTVEGSHYIWYTNLSGIVNHINEWKAALDRAAESEYNEV